MRDANDLSGRQIVFFVVLPLIGGIALMYYAFLLKEEEFTRYRSATLRITLMFLGTSIAFMANCLLSLVLMVRLCKCMGWDYMKRASKGNTIFSIGMMVLMLAPFFTAIVKLDAYNNRLELDALKQHGTYGQFVIDSTYYSPGKGSHYEYYFRVHDSEWRVHTLHVNRPGNYGLYVGDTVTVKYLPTNPRIFREQYDEGL